MKKLLCSLLCLASLLFCQPALAIIEQIEEIYTESTGNNQYEAKIKAIDLAMHRAFYMLADKLGVQDNNLENVTYEELKNVFKDINIRTENIKIYNYGAFYSAIIKFTFKPSNVNILIEKYCSEEIKKRFFEAMIIPVFKLNHKIFLDETNKQWVGTWQEFRTDLADNKIFYPQFDKELKKRITPQNILKLNYDDFLNSVNFKLYKKIIIPIAEYFTNNNDGSTYLKVNHIIISSEKVENLDFKYPLPNDVKKFNQLTKEIIKDFIKKYGRYEPSSYTEVLVDQTRLNNFEKLIKLSGVNKENFFNFLIEVNYEKDTNIIREKLSKIKIISRFIIEPTPTRGLRVRIYTDATESELAEAFYYNSLSFYFNEFKEPILINIRDGS